ncbi:MAG: transglutaminase-like domain-containing protein, partial [Nannocystaceae bacterium]
PGRIAPQALLESDAIELVLSRSDARESPALRRLIRLAQRELTRLVNRQIDAIRPLPWYLRAPHAIAGALRNSLVWRMLTASVIGAVIAFGLGWWMWGEHIAATIGVGGPAIAVAGPGSYVGQDSGRYRDLADFYRGPQVDVLDSEGASIAMRYTPPDSGIHFAALIIEHLDADGTPRTQLRRDELAPYINSPCADDSCVQIELDLDAPPGLMRLPVPTGHRVDLASVRLGDRPHSVLESIHGEAVLELAKATRETLRYTAGPATPPRPPPTLDPDPLPRELRKAAEAQRDKPVAARIDALVALVRARVRYSTEPEIQARHREARSRGQGFVERTLEIGAGDCDMQNGVLAALLKHAKVPARLAVGYIGREGRTSPWLHAWVEYRDGAGPWRIADASESSAPPALVTPELQGVGEGPDGPVVTAEDTGAPTTYAELPEGTGASAPPDEPAAAVEGAAEPAPEGGALARALRSPPVWAGSGVALLLLLLLARQSTRRQIAVDREQDLAGLLQGALQQPDAFRAMPAVFQRPLIPLADGKAISLDRARALAATGALLRTGRRVSGVDGTTHLTADAIAGGATVLDDTSPEGQAVADALGAIDLDEWDGLLADARTTPLLDAVNHHFVTSGERWRVLASQALSVPLKSIDLAQLRLRRAPLRGKRVVLVDERSLWLADCDALLTESPKLAVFSAIEVIVERLDLAPEQRARLLSELAGDAIREAARRGGVA